MDKIFGQVYDAVKDTIPVDLQVSMYIDRYFNKILKVLPGMIKNIKQYYITSEEIDTIITDSNNVLYGLNPDYSPIEFVKLTEIVDKLNKKLEKYSYEGLRYSTEIEPINKEENNTIYTLWFVVKRL